MSLGHSQLFRIEPESFVEHKQWFFVRATAALRHRQRVLVFHGRCNSPMSCKTACVASIKHATIEGRQPGWTQDFEGTANRERYFPFQLVLTSYDGSNNEAPHPPMVCQPLRAVASGKDRFLAEDLQSIGPVKPPYLSYYL